MRNLFILTVALVSLTACGDNFTPTPKVASYDAATDSVIPPHPCPDWSQSQTYNYRHEVHSNFGCAVNNDTSLQLEDPQDLVRGHGLAGPDMGVTEGVIEQYRAGKIPAPLTPLQDEGSSSGGGGS